MAKRYPQSSTEDLSAEAEKAVRELWVVDYIHKSIDLNMLVARIKKVLNLSKKGKK